MSQIVLPYVYKITNIHTNQFYIGSRTSKNQKHHSEDLGFKYFTSSKVVKELGFSNFKIDWIEEFPSAELAYDWEQMMIYVSLKDPLCLNKSCYFKTKKFSNAGIKHSEETKNKISKVHKNKIVSIETKEKMKLAKQNMSFETKQLMSKSAKKRLEIPENNNMYGKNHTQKSKEAISKTRIDNRIAKGKNNPNYGKIGAAANKKWIHDLKQNHETYIDIEKEFILYPTYSLGRLPSKSKGTKFSIESKNNISIGCKNKPKIYCIHCDRYIVSGNFKRWHGDKCKMK